MTTATLASIHQQFEQALPVIRRAALYYFRHRRRDRDDLLAETLACCWHAWQTLVKRGRDPRVVGITAIARWCAKHALKGRRLGNRSGGRNSMDIFHRRAQKIGGFRLISYDTRSASLTASESEVWREWLAADYSANPADSAAMRIDFSAWIASIPERRRMAAELLAQGHRTLEVAQRLSVSPPAITQTRNWLEKSWREFQHESLAAST